MLQEADSYLTLCNAKSGGERSQRRGKRQRGDSEGERCEETENPNPPKMNENTEVKRGFEAGKAMGTKVGQDRKWSRKSGWKVRTGNTEEEMENLEGGGVKDGVKWATWGECEEGAVKEQMQGEEGREEEEEAEEEVKEFGVNMVARIKCWHHYQALADPSQNIFHKQKTKVIFISTFQLQLPWVFAKSLLLAGQLFNSCKTHTRMHTLFNTEVIPLFLSKTHIFKKYVTWRERPQK